jgi:hypothetical protein
MKYNFEKQEIDVSPQDVKAALGSFKEMWKRLRVPKNIKDKIGIIIALNTEGDKEKKRLKNDFIDEIHRYLLQSKIENQFYIIGYPQALTEKIIDDKFAFEYLVRSRAHFIVYGYLAQRNIDGENSYVFKLHGVVRHLPIIKPTHDRFQNEFIEALPAKITFPEKIEVLGFDFTWQSIGCVIKFIIGGAALVSGDLELSYKLYKELEADIKTFRSDIPVIQRISERIPFRVAETLRLLAERNYFMFVKTRDASHIIKSEKYITELQNIFPDDYKGHLIKAILLFFKGEVDSAINELVNINNGQDITWRYSLGFLYAFKGDIINALEQYKKIAYGPTSPNVPNDSEVFISDILEKHPNCIQLIFFRGLINFKVKNDNKLAKDDFTLFLNKEKANSYARLVDLAKKYLKEIHEQLGL